MYTENTKDWRDFDCKTCGREYGDFTLEEIKEATESGYCCEYCREDNEPNPTATA